MTDNFKFETPEFYANRYFLSAAMEEVDVKYSKVEKLKQVHLKNSQPAKFSIDPIQCSISIGKINISKESLHTVSFYDVKEAHSFSAVTIKYGDEQFISITGIREQLITIYIALQIFKDQTPSEEQYTQKVAQMAELIDKLDFIKDINIETPPPLPKEPTNLNFIRNE